MVILVKIKESQNVKGECARHSLGSLGVDSSPVPKTQNVPDKKHWPRYLTQKIKKFSRGRIIYRDQDLHGFTY